MLEKMFALMIFLGMKPGSDPSPYPHPAPCLYSQLGFQDAREMGERGAEESEASLQMASLTEHAVFHSLPKSSQDLGPFEQPKPPARRSSRAED